MMAGGGQDGNCGGQVVSTEEQVQALPEELCRQILEEWKDSTADYVRKKLFNKKQFVSDDDMVMGGTIQKLISNNLHISGAERQRKFLEE